MLRALVLVLLLANLGYYAWTQAWLEPVLGRPGLGEREPDRVARQVQPETVTVLSGTDARSAMAEAARRARADASQAALAAQAMAASAAEAGASVAAAAGELPACLELGPLVQAELASAERALRALPLPATRWTTQRSELGGRFILYMGKYADRDALRKKQDELKQLGVTAVPLTDAPALMPGLELGRFDDRTAANAALDRLGQRGVRSARVAVLVAPTPVAMLRIDKPDAALTDKLLALDLGSADRRFRPCAPPAVASR